MIVGFVLGAGVTLAVVAIATRTLAVVAIATRAPVFERALTEHAGPGERERGLDLETWNDVDLTYALHDGEARRSSRLDRHSGEVVGSARSLYLLADPETLNADRRIADWNRPWVGDHRPARKPRCGRRRD